FGGGGRCMSPVETNDIEVSILDPDPSDERRFGSLGFHFGLHIEDDAAHFAKKLAAHICEIVFVAIERRPDHDRLREALRNVVYGVRLLDLLPERAHPTLCWEKRL